MGMLMVVELMAARGDYYPGPGGRNGNDRG